MSAAPSKGRPSSGSKAPAQSIKAGGGGISSKDAPRTTQLGFNTGNAVNERLLFVAQVLVGYKVELQVRCLTALPKAG